MLSKKVDQILKEAKEKLRGEVVAEYNSFYSYDMMEKAFDFACSTQTETTKFVLENFKIKLDKIVTLTISDADLTPLEPEEHHQDNKWHLSILKQNEKYIAYLILWSELKLK